MGIGTQNGGERPPAPNKNRWWAGKMNCKFREKAENHENYPRRSWALNHMGNVSFLDPAAKDADQPGTSSTRIK
jgi:hypothetical protein